PCGMVTLSAAPTDLIFSPSIRTTWFSNIFPDLLSNRPPARIATIVFWAFAENATAKSSENVVRRNFREVNYVLRVLVLASTNKFSLFGKEEARVPDSEPPLSTDENY